MHTVSVVEARSQFSALLDEVEGGAEVLITRRGKPVARLEPADAGFSRSKAMKAAEGMRAASKGRTLGGLSLKALVSEGQR